MPRTYDHEELLHRLTELKRPPPELWKHEGSWIIYQPAFVRDIDFDILDQSIVWQQDAMQIYGKEINLPRLTAWYGDPGTDYTYSGIYNIAKPWTETLTHLRDKLVTQLGTPYNAVLANRYSSGSQHMGYHNDREGVLGSRPLIASLSFGETRRFLLKAMKSEAPLQAKWDLEHGSLLIMGGDLQDKFLHAISKTTRSVGPRINLTFRHIPEAQK